MSIKKYIKEKLFPTEANLYAKKNYFLSQLNCSLCRCSTANNRNINKNLPQSWEFSGFSQNGEDGIIDYLISNLNNSNKHFLEIGSGNGLENNSSYLAHIKKFSGTQIEGNKSSFEDANLIKPWLVNNLNCFVNKENIVEISKNIIFKNPDLFSIDIDGMDYYITKLILESYLKPKIIVVEYNSAFGPDKAITIPYNDSFDMFKTAYPYLYYGVSIGGWKKLLSNFGYSFLTVETNGVNAFFVNKDDFPQNFFNEIAGLEFRENIHQLRTFKKEHKEQFALISNLDFFEI